MTAVAERVADGQSRPAHARVNWMVPPGLYPAAFAFACALAFLVVRPPVGDLWAARARQSAVAHGVGLTYWFSWFGGGSTPGNYSVLTPFVSAVFGAALLGALATAAITVLCWQLVQGSRYPLAATWAATFTAGFSLWSGRIPFALGTAISIAALIGVREQRRWRAIICTALAVLVSPVSGALIALGLTGTFLVSRSHRVISALTILTAAFTLVVLAGIFGVPGPEGFDAKQALAVTLGLLLLLLARPPKYLTVVILLSVAVCPVLLVVPNGMGSNFVRFVWIWLPVAVIATAGRRLATAVLASALAVCAGALGTMRDLAVARAPMSSPSYYAPLATELDTLAALTTYRLEVVSDGSHTAAYALLGHAMLARGYETQTDNILNPVLTSRVHLNATTFKIWLDDNAVGYLAIGKTSLHPNPEYTLVAAGKPPYLRVIWSSSNWTLYRVASPTPIVSKPARITDADQASMTIEIAYPGSIPIRVRWSKFLTADGPGHSRAVRLTADAAGWTILAAPLAGQYVLHG